MDLFCYFYQTIYVSFFSLFSISSRFFIFLFFICFVCSYIQSLFSLYYLFSFLQSCPCFLSPSTLSKPFYFFSLSVLMSHLLTLSLLPSLLSRFRTSEHFDRNLLPSFWAKSFKGIDRLETQKGFKFGRGTLSPRKGGLARQQHTP